MAAVITEAPRIHVTGLPALLRGGLRPSLGDVVLAALAAQLLYSGPGLSSFLMDGDTGWHIRAGDWMLQNRAVPTTDLFSFARPGAPWYAWEWLSDVMMALVHQRWGLTGIAFLAAALTLAAMMVLFRHMLWRGANVAVAFPVLLLAMGASAVHFLARPHLVTLLLVAISLWMLEQDRRTPGRSVWFLLPLSVVWVNLHGGFFALPASLAVLALGLGIEGWLDEPRRPARLSAMRRYAGLTVAVSVASVLNPYGIQLHVHVARYLTSGWIRDRILEFQSPSFRSEGMLRFEVLLLASLLLGGWLVARRRIADALLLVLWAHLALGSVRHVPIFVLVAAPIVAVELSRLWEDRVNARPPRSAWRIVWTLAVETSPSFRRFSAWIAGLAAAALLLTPSSFWPRDFPNSRFPVTLVQSEASTLAGARVFTSDQWADYLIYRGWPRQKVFVDGRSDFYGQAIGDDYISLMNGRPGWEKLFAQYDFDLALLPREWPLVSLLEQDPAWLRVRGDSLGVVFERASPGTSNLDAHGGPGRR